MGGRVECVVCGSLFHSGGTRYRRRPARYCHPSCRTQFNAWRSKGEYPWWWKEINRLRGRLRAHGVEDQDRFTRWGHETTTEGSG